MTRGSEVEEFLMRSAICRLRVCTRVSAKGGHSQGGSVSLGVETVGFGQMEASWLSVEVSMRSFRDRASAGAILVPGVISQMRSKSWRNKAHRACRLESLWGSLT